MSMGVYSDGSYGAPKDIVYSFPVTCKDGKWTIKQVRAEAVCSWAGWLGGRVGGRVGCPYHDWLQGV